MCVDMMSPIGAIAPLFVLIGSFSFGNNEGLGLSPSLTVSVRCRWLFRERSQL